MWKQYLLAALIGAVLGWLIPNLVDWHMQWILAAAFYLTIAIVKLVSLIRNARYGVKRGRNVR